MADTSENTQIQTEEVQTQQGAASRDTTPDFHPILLNSHAAKSKKDTQLSKAGLNFNLSSFLSYYPMLRLTGYLFEAGYSPANRALQRMHYHAMEDMADNRPLNWKGKIARQIYGDTIPKTVFNPYDVEAMEVDSKGLTERITKPKEVKPLNLEDYADNYKTRFNVAESAVFTSLAAYHSYDTYKQMLSNYKLAVGAELGKDPKDVSFTDMRKSNNPIVVSAIDRFMWQTPMRIGAGLAFIPALWTGIVANSFVISAERTIFYRPLAYDMLSKAINDVQINNLGKEAKVDVVDNLIRVMQTARLDQRQSLIPKEQIQALKPTLSLIADDIIDKQFGIAGALYIMGGGVLIPEDPAQSMKNYEHVRSVGVSGVAEEAKHIRQTSKVPSTKIWEARLMEHERVEGKVAESARRDELIKERRAILARGPMHAGPGGEIDPSARYGNVQMF